MSFASGVYTLASGNPVVTATTISSTTMNNTLSDIATALSTCVLKDGSQTCTASVPFASGITTGAASTFSGNLLFTDATYDIGASGATRPRDFYLSRNAVIGGTIAVTGASTLTGAVTASSSVKSTSATAGIGYGTNAGGTVTQLTSKATGVTLDKICGEIVTHNASLAANASVTFNCSNSAIAANDVVIINHYTGGTSGAYSVYATGGAGVMPVVITNLTAGALSEALTLHFAIIKSVVA